MAMILQPRWDEVQKALLDAFTTATGLPVGLFELHHGKMRAIFSDRAIESFEPYCQLILQHPKGRELCEADQCLRATRTLNCSEDRLELCHAGLYNQAVPIHVGGRVLAVALYGEMLIEEEGYLEEALKKHYEVVKRLELNKEQVAELERRLLGAKCFSLERLDGFKMTLQKVERYFYTQIVEEARLQRGIETVTHEIQTRLQSVVAAADNLLDEMDDLGKDEIRQRVNDEILLCSMALDTVMQNVGGYEGHYAFQKQSIAPVVNEARDIYLAEAKRRGIGIEVVFNHSKGHPSKLEISRRHLQFAINNLVHNGVKYSFRGGDERYRYVLIEGTPKTDFYELVIENYGVGMLPEEIESGKIFQEGYQGILTWGEYRRGAGKGLHLVKQVIDRHHGKIIVHSRQMTDHESPERQPHENQFIIQLPYEQLRKVG